MLRLQAVASPFVLLSLEFGSGMSAASQRLAFPIQNSSSTVNSYGTENQWPCGYSGKPSRHSYLIKHILSLSESKLSFWILQWLKSSADWQSAPVRSRELCCVQPQNSHFIHPCRIKAALGMTGVGKEGETYIPHCRDIFNRSLTYCGMLPKDDFWNLVFLSQYF